MRPVSLAVPKAPRALPVIGHALALLRDPLGFVSSLPAYGALVEIRLGPLRAVMVCDPDLHRQVLLDDRTYDKGGQIIELGREVLGDGLATCPHSRHRKQRRLIQPAFHPTRIVSYVPVMAAQISAVTNRWQDGQVLDINAEMTMLASGVLTRTMFSHTLAPQVMQQAADDISVIVKVSLRRILSPKILNQLPVAGNRRYRSAFARLEQTLETIISERSADTTDHGDLLSALLNTPDKAAESQPDPALTSADIKDQVLSFFAAGAETTSSALAWALHLLGQHPDVRERLHAETRGLLGDEPARHEHLAQLPLTWSVINETLRLYPPGWLLTRSVAADTHLGHYHLPAGTTIAHSPYLMHHLPDPLHVDHSTFDPDRWGTSCRLPPIRSNMAPFAAGPRKCIGDQFAVTEAVLALATITARWHLQPLPGHKVRPSSSVILRPHNLRMRAIAAN